MHRWDSGGGGVCVCVCVCVWFSCGTVSSVKQGPSTSAEESEHWLLKEVYNNYVYHN